MTNWIWHQTRDQKVWGIINSSCVKLLDKLCISSWVVPPVLPLMWPSVQIQSCNVQAALALPGKLAITTSKIEEHVPSWISFWSLNIYFAFICSNAVFVNKDHKSPCHESEWWWGEGLGMSAFKRWITLLQLRLSCIVHLLSHQSSWWRWFIMRLACNEVSVKAP